MKKIFVMAFLALGLSAMAQHVTPLNIEIVELKADSLRALYAAEPTMYRASLDIVAKDLARNGDQIKAARRSSRTSKPMPKRWTLRSKMRSR